MTFIGISAANYVWWWQLNNPDTIKHFGLSAFVLLIMVSIFLIVAGYMMIKR